MKEPRLRDSRKLSTHEPYLINQIPEDIITEIGSYFIYLLDGRLRRGGIIDTYEKMLYFAMIYS